MYFRTMDSWEAHIPPEHANPGRPDSRMYKMLEVSLQFPFFILKLKLEDEIEGAGAVWQTLLVYDVNDAVEFARADFVKRATISMVYPAKKAPETQEYGQIREIRRGVGSDGCVVYEFVLVSGKVYRDIIWSTGKLDNLEVIYPG